MKAYKGDGKTAVEIPAEFQDAAENAHTALVEAAAEGEEALMEKYFENGDSEPLKKSLRGLRAIIRSRSLSRFLSAAGASEIGIGPLLDAIITLMPSPADVPNSRRQDQRTERRAHLRGLRSPGGLRLENHRRSVRRQADLISAFIPACSHPTAGSGTRPKSIEERLGTLSIPRGKEAFPVKVVHCR